ncbi:MAG: hypothetical protein UD103_07710 [Bacteroidales bacterium]|nr:hypothetical protein [Bacteroidales bacterium]
MPLNYELSLDDLKSELREDKLFQDPPKSVLEPEPEIPDEEVEKIFSPNSEEIEEEEEESSLSLKDFDEAPEFIVQLIDGLASSLAEVWTKTDDRSRYELTNKEQQQLTTAWKMYLKTTKKIDMSPSSLLLITTAMIYSPKLIMAMNERKAIKLQEQCQRAES